MFDGAGLSGKADMTVNIEGELPDSVFSKFSINFKGNRLNYKPLGGFQPDLEGAGTVDNNRIALRDLKIGVRGSTITLAGEVLNYLTGTPQSDIRIVASHIKLSDFMLTGSSTEEAEKEEVGPFDLKGLTLGGPIDMGSVAFLGMLVNNLRGNYMLADNQLSLKELTGTLGQGQFRLSGTVNLAVKGLDYTLDLNLERAALKELSKVVSPLYENFVDGTISGNCTVKGNGVTPLRFVRNLEGKGFFTVQNALFKGLSLGTIGSFIRMDGGDGLRFDQGQVQLKLRDGTVDINGGFINPDLGLYPSGSVGFDSSLNIDTIMKLSPAFSRRMMSEKILQYFPQEDGWISLPVEIRGTVYEPQISLSKEVLNVFIEKIMPAVLNEMLKEKQEQGTPGAPYE
jgi:autotransporter translocation and assembly factor TamB